jgi:hypothetical protein
MASMQINLDKLKKIMMVTLSGGFNTSDGTKKVLDDYGQLMSQINPKEYSLLIDCTESGVYEQSALAHLEQLYGLYMKTGFKHIVFVESKNAIQNMQLKKVAQKVPGFTGIFVPTLNDAKNECAK